MIVTRQGITPRISSLLPGMAITAVPFGAAS